MSGTAGGWVEGGAGAEKLQGNEGRKRAWAEGLEENECQVLGAP